MAGAYHQSAVATSSSITGSKADENCCTCHRPLLLPWVDKAVVQADPFISHLPCGHGFHDHCLFVAYSEYRVQQQRQSTSATFACPSCRKDLWGHMATALAETYQESLGQHGLPRVGFIPRQGFAKRVAQLEGVEVQPQRSKHHQQPPQPPQVPPQPQPQQQQSQPYDPQQQQQQPYTYTPPQYSYAYPSPYTYYHQPAYGQQQQQHTQAATHAQYAMTYTPQQYPYAQYTPPTYPQPQPQGVYGQQGQQQQQQQQQQPHAAVSTAPVASYHQQQQQQQTQSVAPAHTAAPSPPQRGLSYAATTASSQLVPPRPAPQQSPPPPSPQQQPPRRQTPLPQHLESRHQQQPQQQQQQQQHVDSRQQQPSIPMPPALPPVQQRPSRLQAQPQQQSRPVQDHQQQQGATHAVHSEGEEEEEEGQGEREVDSGARVGGGDDGSDTSEDEEDMGRLARALGVAYSSRGGRSSGSAPPRWYKGVQRDGIEQYVPGSYGVKADRVNGHASGDGEDITTARRASRDRAASAGGGRAMNGGGGEEVMSAVQLTPDELDDCPEPFLCPISHEVMRDPVVCHDQFSYERRAIEEYMRRVAEADKQLLSPITMLPMDPGFIGNMTLKQLIVAFLDEKLDKKKAALPTITTNEMRPPPQHVVGNGGLSANGSHVRHSMSHAAAAGGGVGSVAHGNDHISGGSSTTVNGALQAKRAAYVSRGRGGRGGVFTGPPYRGSSRP